MKVRIVNSNGIGHDTEVYDAETGEKIKGIYSATIRCHTNEFVRAELSFNIPKVDIFAIAKLSDETKKELRLLKELLVRIDDMEKAQKEVI